MAAVLHAGETAALSHSAAAELWGIIERGTIEVSVLSPRGRKGVHRRKAFETTTRHGIPVTTPICTIVDITTRLTEEALERALGEADKLDLIHPARLRKALDKMSGRPGVGRLKATLDRQTFVLTHSELERLFVPIALRAGCCRPLSQRVVNGERVDFYFPDHDAIVETDGGRYHRTAAQQLKDRRRDQKHYLADVLPLRFTHWQIAHAAREEVEPVLRKLSTRRSRGPSSGRGDPTPPSASGAAAARTRAA